MNPRLVVITGPLEGQIFEMQTAPFSIGRLSSNDLQLLESAASRRHCVLESRGDGFELEDLGSHTGTFVNGHRIEKKRLEHGDFVKVAGSLLLFLERPSEDADGAPIPARLADGDWVAESTVRVSESDAFAPHREKYLAALGSETAKLEHDMVGDSAPFGKMLRFLSRVAPTEATVLIRGESGTGKELAARAIHRNSSRADKPFIAINCATLSETLLESELFGHERGAFTGAVARQIGKLEAADQGTVFLDEVGEIPVSLQAKLLRVLEERAFERVGGRQRIEVDVRIVAATNRDLEAAISEGTFRQDLFYRLDVITLELPPLRQRRGDVPLLASHFLAESSRRLGRPVAGVSPAARERLMNYDWPGNVRELRNAIERAVVLGRDELVQLEDLPATVREPRSSKVAPATYHEVIEAAKRRVILDALDASGGSVAAAARRLELHRNYLHRLIKKLGLAP